MHKLIYVFAIAAILVFAFGSSNHRTETNVETVTILSPDKPCESFRGEKKMYETCRNVWEFERSHSNDVLIVLD